MASKYQVVIPEKVREENKNRPGDKMAVLVTHGVVRMVPARRFSKSKGITPGREVDLEDSREPSDRAQEPSGVPA